MTTVSNRPVDFATAVLSPLIGLGLIIASAAFTVLVVGTTSQIGDVTGQDIPYLLGIVLIALASFGGMPEAHVTFPFGGFGVTFVFFPVLLTALGAYVIYRAHANSEQRRPLFDPADRLINALISGMVLVIAAMALWLIGQLLNPGSASLSLSANVFFMAAGCLILGSWAAMGGRQSVHAQHRRTFFKAFSFAFRYGLAVSLPVAMALCVFATITQPWGASSWVLLGNISAAIWAGLHGGLVTWSTKLSTFGGPDSAGTAFIIAFPDGDFWTGVAIIACAISSLIATILWSKSCHLSPRFALPAAMALIATFCLIAGSYTTGYMRIGTDATRFSALLLISPLTIAMAGGIGLAIDTVARLIAPPTHIANPMLGYDHRRPAGTVPSAPSSRSALQ